MGNPACLPDSKRGLGKGHFRVIHYDVLIQVIGGFGFGANAVDGFYDVTLHGFVGLAFVHLQIVGEAESGVRSGGENQQFRKVSHFQSARRTSGNISALARIPSLSLWSNLQ